MSLESDFLRTEEEVIAEQERDIMEQELLRAATEASLKEAHQQGFGVSDYEFGGGFPQFDLSKFVVQPQSQPPISKPMSKKEIKMCLVIQGYPIPDIDRALMDTKLLKPTLDEVKKRLESYKSK